MRPVTLVLSRFDVPDDPPEATLELNTRKFMLHVMCVDIEKIITLMDVTWSLQKIFPITNFLVFIDAGRSI